MDSRTRATAAARVSNPVTASRATARDTGSTHKASTAAAAGSTTARAVSTGSRVRGNTIQAAADMVRAMAAHMAARVSMEAVSTAAVAINGVRTARRVS